MYLFLLIPFIYYRTSHDDHAVLIIPFFSLQRRHTMIVLVLTVTLVISYIPNIVVWQLDDLDVRMLKPSSYHCSNGLNVSIKYTT